MEIAGFENYLIYEDGLIYGKKRDNFLKCRIGKDGYTRIDLSKDGKRYHMLLHRLLALTYIENPNNYPVVDHIDRNKQNNDLSNLRWGTSSDNNRNKSMRKDNKSGYQFIYKNNQANLYIFQHKQTTKFYKSFKTLEEAVEFRDNYLSTV